MVLKRIGMFRKMAFKSIRETLRIRIIAIRDTIYDDGDDTIPSSERNEIINSAVDIRRFGGTRRTDHNQIPRLLHTRLQLHHQFLACMHIVEIAIERFDVTRNGTVIFA